MRRKAGTLVPLEVDILDASVALRARGVHEAHGFLLARAVGDGAEAKRLTSYGTLYKALDRLERGGYLESRWEDPDYAAEAARPRRRFYRITAAGEAALRAAQTAEAHAAEAKAGPRTDPSGAPVR